jgi:hypothetical protein
MGGMCAHSLVVRSIPLNVAWQMADEHSDPATMWCGWTGTGTDVEALGVHRSRSTAIMVKVMSTWEGTRHLVGLKRV